MNYKRIMISLAMVVSVGAVVAGATGAFYSDTETSEDNIFTAGSIDLQVDHLKQTYNGVDCATCEMTVSSQSGDEIIEKDGESFNQNDAFEVEGADDWAEAPGGSEWIWGEQDQPAANDDTSYTFEKTFNWQGPVSSDASLSFSISGDDNFLVKLNGEEIADSDDVSGDVWETIYTIDADDFENEIQTGQNTLTFEVENTEGYWAGLVYELSIDGNCEEEGSEFQNQCQLWQEQNLSGDETFFNFGDIKPGDHGSNVISLHSYSNDAYSCLVANDGESSENDVLESEGDDTDNDGELQEYIDFFAWIDGEGEGAEPNGEYESGETPLGTATLGNLESIASFDGNNSLTGTSTAYVGIKWCAGDISVSDSGDVSCDGSGMLNDAQSDSFESDLTAYAVQTRNNEGFSCEDIQPEDLQTGTDNGTESIDAS